jgi:hypothetical protein
MANEIDPFPGFKDPRGPFGNATTLTPHDTNLLKRTSSMLYVGVAGDLKVTTANGDEVIFENCPVGFHSIRAKIVWSTGTAATDIIALS